MRFGFVSMLIATVVLIGGLILLLPSGHTPGDAGDGELTLYCAAGIQAPVKEILDEYRQAYGVQFSTQYAGSGRLRGTIVAANQGDLFLAADIEYLHDLRDNVEKYGSRRIEEIIPIATQRPVIVVPVGNPRGIAGVDDLVAPNLRVSLANPEAAAVGRLIRKALGEGWEPLWAAREVERATVNEVANDVKIGAADAGIVWDATARQYDGLEIVTDPRLDKQSGLIVLGVLSSSSNPTAALRFARFLTARDRGLQNFAAHGYEVVQGDVWAFAPELELYAGTLNQVAAEEIIKEFARREGCQVLTRYGGCGALVADMKVGARPDTYFACDVKYMQAVQDLFDESQEVTSVDMVLAVAKGNPLEILTLDDLTREGLRFGMCNPDISALGNLSRELLTRHGIFEEVRGNIADTPSTAARLVEYVALGSMDAAIVYRANTVYARDRLDVIGIDDPAAMAVQPIAVGRDSDHHELATRLMQRITAADSRAAFEAAEFNWLGNAAKQ